MWHKMKIMLKFLVIENPLGLKNLEESFAFNFCCDSLSVILRPTVPYCHVMVPFNPPGYAVYVLMCVSYMRPSASSAGGMPICPLCIMCLSRSRWPRGLRCGSAAACWLGLRVRISPWAVDFGLLWVLCFVSYRSLRRADHSSRGVLPSVVCLSVAVKPQEWGGLGPLLSVAPWNTIMCFNAVVFLSCCKRWSVVCVCLSERERECVWVCVCVSVCVWVWVCECARVRQWVWVCVGVFVRVDMWKNGWVCVSELICEWVGEIERERQRVCVCVCAVPSRCTVLISKILSGCAETWVCLRGWIYGTYCWISSVCEYSLRLGP